MNETVLIALTGFCIAFFHAAIPTHWLPFVITARTQRWDRNKTISVTALAGTGHVLFTAFLGILIAWFGIALHERIGRWFPWIAGGVLIVFGLFYVYRQISGTGHEHSHLFGGHSHHGSTPHLQTHSAKSIAPAAPHGGKLIDIGNGLLEIAISAGERGSRFRLYPIPSPNKHAAVLPNAGIILETVRSNRQRQRFAFQESDGYLVSTDVVPEPHQFTVVLGLIHGDHQHTYETRFPVKGEKRTIGETVDIVTSRRRVSDRVAITSLLMLLTFSPCESFLPVYVSGVRYGWAGFVLLTIILSIATVAGMVIFTWLTLSRLEKLNLRFLEKYESGIIGSLLSILGILIILIEK
jgi:hypothetical protein